MALINCPKCGAPVSDQASICPKCGSSLHVSYNDSYQNSVQNQNAPMAPAPINNPNQSNNQYINANSQQQSAQYTQGYQTTPQMYNNLPVSEKSWTTTLILAIFLGAIGVHRFYVGKAGTGILMLLTCGGAGIWVLIDIITIATKSFKDANGAVISQ